MKHLFFCMAALWVFSQAAFAAKYGMAGCGLGSLIIKEDGILQIFAATSNGTAGNQTFGITLGTSNCTPASKMAAISKQEHFITNNLNDLYIDMSQGDGEALRAFADTLGCDQDAYPYLQKESKMHLKKIFTAPGALAVLERAKEVLRANSTLNSTCKHLS